MPFEDELSSALRDTAGSFEPDLTSLVNSGVKDGRRRRTRRTLGIIGSVSALALVGVGGTLASGALSSAQRSASANVADHGRATTAVAPTPSAAAFTGQQMLAKFESLLPKGTLTNARGTGITSREKGPFPILLGPTASVTFNDAQGQSAIGISVQRQGRSAADLSAYTSCPGSITRPDATCSVTHGADGSVLVLLQGLEYPSGPSKEKDWTATLVTRDGGIITLDETNSAQEKGAVARPEPVLSLAQLKSIVSDPFWRTLLAELPPPPIASQPSSPAGGSHGATTMPSAAIISTLHSLLPQGLTMSVADQGTAGYLGTTVDDGRGKGVLEVNADFFDPKDTNSAKSGGNIFAGASVLPDGSKVIVRQEASEHGGAGAVYWTVQVLHPDGRRIVVGELNAASYSTAKDRTAPVLTIEQLKALAENPLWVAQPW